MNSCSSCGVLLNGSEKIFTDDINTVVPAADVKPVNSQNTKKIKKTPETKGKQLSNIQLFYLAFGLLLLGLAILYSTGVMDSGSPAAKAQIDNPALGGANLSNLDEIRNLEELVRNTPGNSENIVKLAHLLNDSGFYQKAIDRYQEYLKLIPKDADVIVDIGVCYFQLRMYNEALANFKKGIEINPKHQIAHLNSGVVYAFGLKDIVEAKKWWKKAVEFDPNSDIGKKAQEFLNQNK